METIKIQDVFWTGEVAKDKNGSKYWRDYLERVDVLDTFLPDIIDDTFCDFFWEKIYKADVLTVLYDHKNATLIFLSAKVEKDKLPKNLTVIVSYDLAYLNRLQERYDKFRNRLRGKAKYRERLNVKKIPTGSLDILRYKISAAQDEISDSCRDIATEYIWNTILTPYEVNKKYPQWDKSKGIVCQCSDDDYVHKMNLHDDYLIKNSK